MLLNASKRVRKGRPKNFVPEEDIRPLADAFLEGEPVAGEIAVITREQAKEADYNLSPSRWVGAVSNGDSADLNDIMARFEAALDEEAAASSKLRAALEKLKALT